MDFLRQYVMGVVSASVFCAMILSLGKAGKQGPLLRLVCGLFLCIALLSPLGDFPLEQIPSLNGLLEASEQDVQYGQAYRENQLGQIIKANTEAYILDKAQALSADVEVEIILTEDQLPVPESVRIQGTVSPYDRAQLEAIIEKDLGIAKENQQWSK